MSVLQKPQVSHSIEHLARAGYAAKGVVYAVIGFLAARAALGAGGEVGGSKNAIDAIGDQAFGRILLLIVGVGLFGYVLWRLVQALADPEHKGKGAKGLAVRAGYLGSGLAYLGLALSALRDAAGRGSAATEDSKADEAAQAMSLPFGDVLVMLVGIGVMGFGAWQVYYALKKKFVKRYDTARMTAPQLSVATQVGRLGLIARGATFLVMGGYFTVAGFESDPGEARGLGGVLSAIAQQPSGWILLALLAVGLVAYGVYCLSEARWRVIRPA